jgi:hypothetical protein
MNLPFFELEIVYPKLTFNQNFEIIRRIAQKLTKTGHFYLKYDLRTWVRIGGVLSGIARQNTPASSLTCVTSVK